MADEDARLTGDTAPEGEVVTLALRGRDLTLTPPPRLAAASDAVIFGALFTARDATLASGLLTRDRRGRFFRAQPITYARLRAALLAADAYPLVVAFALEQPLPWEPQVTLTARPYQREALTAWREAGYRGVVVLPTGGGKTLLGALAIAELACWSLVVVPTIDLLRQWRDALAKTLNRSPDEIGLVGGGERELRAVTVITYESAQLHPELLNQFGLLVFDECHHLPAPSYRQIAEGAVTPHRMGLSATPERADLEHTQLERLIGPEVYRRRADELAAARYLAEYDEERLVVTLDAQARARYDAARAAYSDYLRRRRLIIATPADFQRKILWASARDPEARAAMLAWREARALALNAPAKLTLLETLFERHRDERVLVFSEYNALVAEISVRFAIPQITHKTPTEERRLILDRFREGRYTKLVTGRVLNEGVDIPDCGVAVIVSGTSVRRDYVQRLGRVLRPKETRATLYELVTEDTTEERVSERRRTRED